MKTVGEVLSRVRKEKGLTIEQIAEKTKIRQKFITAIEENAFENLPSSAVAQGFIKNYAEYLGASASYVLALFRRDFVADEAGKIIPRQLAEPLVSKPFWQSPRFGYVSAGLGLIIIVGLYLFFQYFTFWNGPRLAIEQPPVGFVTESDFTEVVGCTEPEAVVRINAQLVALDTQGCFHQGVPLEKGENVFLIVAENSIGRQQVQKVVVIREEG